MDNIYTVYKCRTCRKDFILPSDDVHSMSPGRYLTCPYCNSKRISKEGAADSLKECMKERSYRRIKGALRQK